MNDMIIRRENCYSSILSRRDIPEVAVNQHWPKFDAVEPKPLQLAHNEYDKKVSAGTRDRSDHEPVRMLRSG